jgi:hypothetical protein
LNRTGVSNQGMEQLARFPALKHLEVRETNVTLNGLVTLGASETLERVGMNVELDPEEATRLREAWPWLSSNGKPAARQPAHNIGVPIGPAPDPFSLLSVFAVPIFREFSAGRKWRVRSPRGCRNGRRVGQRGNCPGARKNLFRRLTSIGFDVSCASRDLRPRHFP